MKRKSVGIAVVIAALAVLVNVFALKSASVTNKFTVKVADTTTALVSIEPATSPDNDVTFDTTTHQAVISLPINGFQPGSSYTFYPAFKITNHSADGKTLGFAPGTLPAGVTVTLVDGSNTDLTGSSLAATGGNFTVGLKIDLSTSAAIGTTNLSVDIKAQ